MYGHLFDLEGRTIIVTGASSGLGKGLSAAYASAGAKVVLASRNLDKLNDLADELIAIGGIVLPVRTDVTRREDVENLLKTALDKFEVVDVLLNNAGISIPGLPAEQAGEKDMQTIIDTNLKGVFLCGTTIGRYMIQRGKGKIINMSSVLAETTWSGASIYSCSKAAINQITKSWALEWAPKNVTVNAIGPTFIITEMNRHLFDSVEYRGRVLRHTPMGRLGTINDLIGPAIFLAADASDFMTGHILYIDGGWNCA